MVTTFGFIYESLSAPGRFDVATGADVRNASRDAPWIVVDHELHSVIVTAWPGRLVRVEVLDDVGLQGLAENPGYTRAAAVRVVEHLHAPSLFGKRGDAVAEVIDAAHALSFDDARHLSEAIHVDAEAAYSEAWNRWLIVARSPRLPVLW